MECKTGSYIMANLHRNKWDVGSNFTMSEFLLYYLIPRKSDNVTLPFNIAVTVLYLPLVSLLSYCGYCDSYFGVLLGYGGLLDVRIPYPVNSLTCEM